MGEVGSARYEPALLPPCPSIRVLSYSNCQRSSHSMSKWMFRNLAVEELICWFIYPGCVSLFTLYNCCQILSWVIELQYVKHHSNVPLLNLLRRHLLDNLDDKPADETERAPMKNKISFSYCFFILTHRASPVSGPLHRLATAQQAFSSAQCHSSRLTSLVR